jgi:tRNA A37 methylthiotransferase MiaB
MKQRVTERIAKERVEILSSLAKNGQNDYVKRSVGRVVKAIRVNGAGFAALSENYIPLTLQQNEHDVLDVKEGSQFLCKILGVNGSGGTALAERLHKG